MGTFIIASLCVTYNHFNSGMSVMEGRDDIFKELKEKFFKTFQVRFFVFLLIGPVACSMLIVFWYKVALHFLVKYCRQITGVCTSIKRNQPFKSRLFSI